MFKKPSLDEIEKMLKSLHLQNEDFTPHKSDYQLLRRQGRMSCLRSLGLLVSGLLVWIMNDMPFLTDSYRVIFTRVFFTFLVVGDLYRAQKYFRACEVMEEACPISLDDVRKKSEPTI